MDSWMVDIKIQNALKARKQIIISPLGRNGLIFKDILNHRYGIKEKFSIDNVISQWNINCKSVDDLLPASTDDVVIINSDIKNVSEMLKNSIQSKGYETDCMDLPSVYSASTEDIQYLKKLELYFHPKRVKDYQLTRIGRDHDGGYVLIDDFRGGDKVYSFGIADDVSWETDMAELYGKTIFMYDPTIEALPQNHRRFCFHKNGIAGREMDNEYHTLPFFLNENGHFDQRDMVLKIDVEGAEWEVFSALEKTVLNQFSQITIEFHDLLVRKDREIVIQALENITDTHQCIWAHGNNFDFALNTDGICMPNVLEATFVRKDCYEFTEQTLKLPTAFDMPNCREMKDFSLTQWM